MSLFFNLYEKQQYKPKPSNMIYDMIRYMMIFIHKYSALRPVLAGTRTSQATGMALAHCILGKFLEVGCHCFSPPLDVLTFSARCLHVQRRERPLAAEGGTLRGREMFRQFSSIIRLPRNYDDIFNCNWGDTRWQ